VADIHILRTHGLGLQAARKIAVQWAQEAESGFGMACTYQEGMLCDEVSFGRPGVKGVLTVGEDLFELKAQLGFLLSAFKARIESEVVKNLDDLLRR
jgi:putative polyhydroxyalkanoate system protein